MEIRPRRAAKVRGLAFRIGSLVFVASLVTSLAIAWLSARSIEGFLRARIDRKFPELLQSTRTHLHLWYRQRELDLEVFARSPILREGLASQKSSAHAEVRRYLAYVLESSPQYAGLAILAEEGGVRAQAGEPVDLPAPLRKRLAGFTHTHVSGLLGSGEARRQVVSTSIPGVPGMSLHGLLRISALRAALQEIESGETTIGLLAANGQPIAGALRSQARDLQRATKIDGTCLLGEGKERAVAAATTFAPFGWTLAAEEPYDVAFAPVADAVRRAAALNLVLVLLSSAAAFAFGARRVAPVVELEEGAWRRGRRECAWMKGERGMRS